MATFTNDEQTALSVIPAIIAVAVIVIAALLAVTPIPRRAAALAACWAAPQIRPSPYERGIRTRPYFEDDPCLHDASGGESR